MTSRRDHALSYYEALDDGDYEALAALLAEGFVHDRPDRTLAGRDRFVRFMREGRPRTDTAHEVDGVYGPTADGDGAERDGSKVVVQGRLLGDDGNRILAFVDVFSFEGDSIARIDTYTR